MKLQVKFKISASPDMFHSTLDLVRKRTALLIVDMQNDFAHPEGMLGVYGNDLTGALEIIPLIKKLSDAFRRTGSKVIYTMHTFRPDLSDQPKMFREITRGRISKLPGLPHRKASLRRRNPFLIKGSWNAAIVDALAPQRRDIIVDAKHNYDSFYQTDLEQILRDMGTENLLVVGIATNVCVETAIRSAYHRDFRCILLEDCTWTTNPELKENTLKVISTHFGYLSSSDEVLKAVAH